MKFKQTMNITRCKAVQAAVIASLWVGQVAAQGLPTMDAPTQAGTGGMVSTLQGYLFDFATLIGLLVCTVSFVMVASSGVASFKEARERETWGKFAVTVVVGVVLIVAVIWLVTEAAPILSQ